MDGRDTKLNERAGKLGFNPVVSTQPEKEGGDSSDRECQGGTAQEGLMLFRQGTNKSCVRK